MVEIAPVVDGTGSPSSGWGSEFWSARRGPGLSSAGWGAGRQSAELKSHSLKCVLQLR